MLEQPQKLSHQAGPANNFDSLRLIFAILVIFSHSFPLARVSEATEPLSRLTGGHITFGDISVWAFFIISGFLITQSWQRTPNIGRFLKRRVGRIYPGFALAGLFCALIVVPIAAQPSTYLPVSLQSYLLNTLRLQIFQTPPLFVNNPRPNILNGSLWSVEMEFWCYVGLMLLGLMGSLRRRPSVVALFVLVIGLHLTMDISGWTPSGGILGRIFGYPPAWATVLPFYLAGTIFQLYGGQKLLKLPFICLAAMLLVASAFIPHGLILTLPSCGAYLLMSLAYLPLLHPLNLGRYGDFSYGTYLYAMPIQQLLVQRAHGNISPWLLFVEAAPLTLLVGALSWFLVERHFLQRSSRLKHEGILQPERETLSPVHASAPEISTDSRSAAIFHVNSEMELGRVSFAEPLIMAKLETEENLPSTGIPYLSTVVEQRAQRNEAPSPHVEAQGDMP